MNGPEPLRYAVEEFTSDELVVHLSEQVGQTYSTRGEEILVPPGELETMMVQPDTDEVPEKIREPELCRGIRDIKGVEAVGLAGYSIAIRKGVVFEWDEILPQALMYISMHLHSEGEMIEVDTDNATADNPGAVSTGNGGDGKRWKTRYAGCL